MQITLRLLWFYSVIIYKPRKDEWLSWTSSKKRLRDLLVWPSPGIEPRLLTSQHNDLLTALQLPETNYANRNRCFISSVYMSTIHQPGTVGTYLLVLLPAMVNGSNSHFSWLEVGLGTIRYSFINLGRIEGWADLAAWGD